MLILRARAALFTREGLVVPDEASYYGPVWTVRDIAFLQTHIDPTVAEAQNIPS